MGPLTGYAAHAHAHAYCREPSVFAAQQGAGPYQWLRLQMSANYTAGKEKSTVAIMGGVIVEVRLHSQTLQPGSSIAAAAVVPSSPCVLQDARCA